MNEPKKKQASIPKGSYVIISSGSYSDYSFLALAIAIEDIYVDALKAEWFEKNPKQCEDYGFREKAFLSWLVVEKKILHEIRFAEFHLTDYSYASEMWVEFRDDNHG